MSLNSNCAIDPVAINVHSPHLIPLSLLRTGQQATVGEIHGRPEAVHRLREMGLRDGTVVEMVQTGSPCIIRLSGHKLCFRGCEATHILVHRGGGA